jgi:hypothetical protein
MFRHARKLYDSAKLWRNSLSGLANLLHRIVSRSAPIENKDTPHWFVMQNKSSMAMGAWYWVRGNLTWVAPLVVVLLGLLSMNAVMAYRRSAQPPTPENQQTQSRANKADAKKTDSASPRADASHRKAQASLIADRQELAGKLSLDLEKHGLDDVMVVAGGERRETLILSSKIFQDSARRATEMQVAQTYWKDQLCKYGFKAVVLDGRGLFGSWHEYPLRCPKTSSERVSMAAGLQADFEMAGKAIQVQATGPENEDLSLVTSLQGQANRAMLFQQLKAQRIVNDLCVWGFKQVSIGDNSPGSKPSVFGLNCASP